MTCANGNCFECFVCFGIMIVKNMALMYSLMNMDKHNITCIGSV